MCITQDPRHLSFSEINTKISKEYHDALEQLKKLYKLGYNDEAKANQIVEKINILRK